MHLHQLRSDIVLGFGQDWAETDDSLSQMSIIVGAVRAMMWE
ncbi:hypothetical protein PanWU01x14_193520 [Parasponia andersonii]|uniref:Uncharacterized protein n=1 Tax=Parasponia andersonii TaxID=3476 RepID=A0A2P5C0R1_PARAD|nr:hypothetical protein PanWU01x14_193520 [Parasponia andersonii]